MTSPRSARQGQNQPDQLQPDQDQPVQGQDKPYQAGTGPGYRVTPPPPGPSWAWLGSDVAAAAWPAFMAAGVGSVILGVILLAWPAETLTVVAVLIGAALIVAGLLRLVDGFTAHDESAGRRVASIVIGLIAIVLGLFCLRHYHLTIAVLAIIVGLFWVIHGIAEIGIGLFAGGVRGHGLTVLSGILSLGAGLIVLFWPTISLTVLVAVIGIWLIVYGILAAVLAFRLRRSGSAPPGAGNLTAA
jgi:uncharacterized membrane protein HdeD (DUF308 family)